VGTTTGPCEGQSNSSADSVKHIRDTLSGLDPQIGTSSPNVHFHGQSAAKLDSTVHFSNSTIGKSLYLTLVLPVPIAVYSNPARELENRCHHIHNAHENKPLPFAHSFSPPLSYYFKMLHLIHLPSFIVINIAALTHYVACGGLVSQPHGLKCPQFRALS